jgi:type II secretory pathway component PulF
MQVADDIQGGSSISKAMERHPKIFSSFYTNMVKSGEESGKLNDIFLYLADYLERNYNVTAKARNALIYPTFVISMFIAVMLLMFTVVIPKIGGILAESGQELPIYTKIILNISNFFFRMEYIFSFFAIIVAI